MMPVPQTVMAMPRCSSGKISHMIACAIGITDPPPSPCKMRMATRNSRFGAMPERKELAVKVTVQIRKKRRRPKTEVSHPLAGMTTALAARYEVMTHDISSMLAENEPCMWGRATLVMLVSSTCITVTNMTESVIAHFRTDPTGASLTARHRIRAGGSCLHMCTENPGDVKLGPRPPAQSDSSGKQELPGRSTATARALLGAMIWT